MISFGRGLRELSDRRLDVDDIEDEQRPSVELLVYHLGQGVSEHCLPPASTLPVVGSVGTAQIMDVVAEYSTSDSDYAPSDDEDSRSSGGDEGVYKPSLRGGKNDGGQADGIEEEGISSAKWMESGAGKCAFESYLAEALGTRSGAGGALHNCR